jgi:hypothetical protein
VRQKHHTTRCVEREKEKMKKTLKGNFNHFAQLRFDAEQLLCLANSNSDSYIQTSLARSSILLSIVSLEVLINMVIDEFVPKTLPDVFIEDMKKWPTVKKWRFIPEIVSNKKIDPSKTPFQYLKPLFEVRNSFVHAEPETFIVSMVLKKDPNSKNWIVDENQNPDEFSFIKLSKDPANWLPKDGERIKQITDSLISFLNISIDGLVFKDDWWISDRYYSSDGQCITLKRRHQNEINMQPT